MRIKKSTGRRRRKKRLIKLAKGYMWDRSKKFRAAKQALMKAWSYAYRDRRRRKRDFRRLWQIRINAAARQQGLNYSKFIFGLKKEKINLNRKMLASLAQSSPEIFSKIAQKAKKNLK